MIGVLIAFSLIGSDPVLLDRPLPAFLHGQEFRAALAQPLTATWDNVSARSLLHRISETQQIGVLLDRRVDPTTHVALTLSGEPVMTAFLDVAQTLRCGTCVVGHTVYVGPLETTDWLRTTVEQHEGTVVKDGGPIPEPRQFALLTRKTIHWQDLDTPRDILMQIAKRYDLDVSGIEQVPHDLWASATIPYATSAEALCLVLRQLDLDFEWRDDGDAIAIIPYRLPRLIEKRYLPRKSQTAAAALAAWQSEWPHLQGRIDGKEIVIAARVEDHERLAGRPPLGESQSKSTDEPVPLRRRRFTLRVQNVPVRAIMRELEKSGVTFQFDAAAFEKLMIDLDSPISLDVKEMDADDFLKTLFQPVGVTFTIDDRTVSLKPAAR